MTPEIPVNNVTENITDNRIEPRDVRGDRRSEEAMNETLTRLRALLGQDAVLLPIPTGKKGPVVKSWQTTTIAAMDDPAYLRRLARGNIGVLQGQPSNGLCSIDVDADEDVGEFLELNPELDKTLQSRGFRGRNFWVRIKDGQYPKVTKLCRRDGEDWGEWRSTGGQTVIHGKHPDGPDYKLLNQFKPLEIAFASIVWPDKLDHLPWDFDLYYELVSQHGAPYELTKNGLKLNPMFFVAKFAAEHLVNHEPDEQQFYLYSEPSGLWRPQTEDAIKHQFALDLKAYSDSQRLPQILSRRTHGFLSGLTEMLKGHVEKRDAFHRKPGVIHVGNGMLHLDVDPPELREFSPDYYSRNQCPIELVDGAECPRFVKDLLLSALPADDVSLLQRWAGSLLLGGNVAQRLLLLTGRAGGGKSTVVEILENVIGPKNVAEMRTEQLSERFEIGRFLDKLLLTGKDVPATFLMRKGASSIKKLVGHDLLSAELKQSNVCFNVRGEFAVAITCNSRLRVLLEGDADAWRRRLLLIEYNKPKPKRRIADFAEKLLLEEGPGILVWMSIGAIEHLRELEAGGDFVLTKTQGDRVELLLAESDSVREFVRLCLKGHPSQSVTNEDLQQAYKAFCQEAGYDAIAPHTVAKSLPDLIAEIHHVHKRNDIETDFGTSRGWKGLELGRNDI
jgi:P4 family phage/plasmid primase-like protien